MLSHVRALEGDLATLSQESRRSVPAVKEAAEHALLELRKAQHGSSQDFVFWRTLFSQSLQPVYLACNHVDAPRSLLTAAMGALQRAVVTDTLLTAEYLNVARVLEIQSGSSDESMRLRVLQILPLVLAQRSCALERATCAVALGLCFGFIADKSPAIRAAAAASLHQSVSLMFERAASEPPSSAPDAPGATAPELGGNGGGSTALASCEAFFSDMICCAGGVPSQWMRRSTPGLMLRALCHFLHAFYPFFAPSPLAL